MSSLLAFFRKELLDQLRSGKLLFLTILFVLFGILNPAVAKLTPWLLEIMADSMADSGMTITLAEVTAMDSWVQFFKNMPIALIVFVLMEGSIFTKEYQSGTLVLFLTKGLSRYKVIIAKASLMILLWTLGYWLCYGITYSYNAYFWDNSIAKNLAFSAGCWWIFGLWVISLTVLFSTLCQDSTGVLLGSGAVVLASTLLGFFPKLQKYLPTLLSDGNSLIYSLAETEAYTPSLLIAAAMGILCFALSIPLFNKKQL